MFNWWKLTEPGGKVGLSRWLMEPEAGDAAAGGVLGLSHQALQLLGQATPEAWHHGDAPHYKQ